MGQARIVRRRDVCGGAACIAGTRIRVYAIVDTALAGMDDRRVCERHRIDPATLRAVWAYVARFPHAVGRDAVHIEIVLLGGVRDDAYARERRALARRIEARERLLYAVRAGALARRRLSERARS